MSKDKAHKYAERFARVFDYIDNHLDGDLSVERLSQVANFSKFHFHRQFCEYTGISVARYVQLMRLRQASYQLVFSQQTRIIDVALASGFDCHESFSRAFKQAFGQTPRQFRQQPAWQNWHEQFRTSPRQESPTMQVKIIDFDETHIAALEHRGPPKAVNDSVRIFIDWRRQSGLSPVSSSRTFGLVYDNPDTTKPEDFRFDICGEVDGQVPSNPQGVINKRIPAGRCAVVRHHGSHQRIGDSAYYLYRDWLPQSGEELRDFPLFFHYLNLITDTPEHELITDVYLPLQARAG